MTLHEEPSRLERPEAHYRWAISVADAKAAELRKKYNEDIRFIMTEARVKRDATIREMRRTATPEYAGLERERVNSILKGVERKARADRDKNVREYRSRILAELGYPEERY